MTHSRKRYWLLSLVALSLGVLSCGGSYFSGVRTGYVGGNQPGHVYGSYASFDGSERRTFAVTAGQSIDLRYEATLNNGALSIILRDANDAELWRVDLQSDSSDSVVLPTSNTGDYTLIVVGDETGGSYDVRWDVK